MGATKTISVFCKWPWNKIKVSADGAVRNCCFQNQPLCDISNLNNEWRTGSCFQKIRASTEQGNVESTTCLPLMNCPHLGVDRYDPKNKKSVRADALYPTIIELDLPNTTCNIGNPIPSPSNPACIMCPRSCENFVPDGSRFEETLQLLRPWIAHCKEFWLAGLGESFWRQQYLEVLTKLDYFQYKNYCRYVTFSNGTLFGERTREEFIRLIPKSQLIFSLDAGTRETYQKIRRLDAFDLVVNNILQYTRDSRRNPDKQMVYVSYNINLLNVEEVERMVTLWKDENIQGIGFNPTYRSGAAGLEPILANKDNYETFRKAGERIRRIAAKHKMKNFDIVSPLEMYFGSKQ